MIATQGTIDSDAYGRILRNTGQVYSQACPKFVPLIEMDIQLFPDGPGYR